jgi:GNAT superfamily N-acetyltransferase
MRPTRADDRDWMEAFLRERWGSERMAVHDKVFYPVDFPGFIAEQDGQRVGVLTYEVEGPNCEIVFIDSGKLFAGIGTALLDAVKEKARQAGCTRLWLVTTNDNLDAIRFYQRRGFVLSALRPNTVAEARRLKPEIPLVGDYGIPLRDELEFEMELS